MKSFYLPLVLALVFSICSCASVSNQANAPEKPLPLLQMTLSHDDARVGQYVSSWDGFRTSSYWIEGPTGLILIDTQFLLSAGDEAIYWAEKKTGKKVVLAIVLHPNPDKFNGTAHLQKLGIPVITSQEVLDLIPAVHRLRVSWFYDRFKPDYPLEEPRPEAFGSSTREMSAAGLQFKLHVLGAGCSGAHVVVEFEKHVFVGDLVTIGFHSWLELGRLNDWLKRLDEIEALHPKWVHTGRGGSGEADVLGRERKYLKTVLAIVGSHHKGKVAKEPLSDELSEKILAEILAKYPSYDYPAFVENGLDNVWELIH